MLLIGKLHVDRVRRLPANAPFADAEFRVFSQFGDDGIIQYLIHTLPIEPETFVELGVGDYSECNTRFLLMNDNWRGLAVDADSASIDSARSSPFFWRHDLSAVSAFITRDNVNDLMMRQGYSGDVGILSIDIDGNDYWVLEAINCVRAALIIAEYNSVFGARHTVSIPYDPRFERTRAHYSNLYFGCSLKSLQELLQKRGYALVGCNTAGNNAFFVREDLLGPLRAKSVEEAYVRSRFRESRDAEGNLSFLTDPNRLDLIGDLVVVDTMTHATLRIAELG
jgi:hypothetical protein